ncbi:LamG-like jellyroll fold domain-containing protein [Planctomycetota bacterium]
MVHTKRMWILLIVLAQLTVMAHGKNKWTGNGDGTYWDSPGNWNKNRVPLPDEDAQIDVDGTNCVIDELSTGASEAVCNELQLMHRGSIGAEMTLTVDGGTLRTNSRLLIGSGTSSKPGGSGTVVVQSGQVYVPQIQLGKYVDNAAIILNGGHIDCSGILEIGVNVNAASKRTLTINGGVLKAVSTVGSSQGAIVLNGGILDVGSLALSNLVSLDISNGTLILAGNGDQAETMEGYAQAGYITVFGESASRGGLVTTYDPDLDQTLVTADANLVDLTKAWGPTPVDDGVPVDTNALMWNSGNMTATTQGHDVYFGTDVNAVTNATVDIPLGVYLGRQDTNGIDPGELVLGATYYWRVDQIDAETGEIYPGELWSYEVEDETMIDDFDDYGTWEDVLLVWEEQGSAWNDISSEFSAGGNSLLVTLNHPDQTPDQKGANGSMILKRDMDFSMYGIRALAFDFSSDPNQGFVQDIYVELDDGTTSDRVTIDDPIIVRNRAWGLVDIDLARFTGVDLGKIESLTLGVNLASDTSKRVSVYFDNLRVFPQRCVAERSLASDLNGDCEVDDDDLAILLGRWLEGTVQVTAAEGPDPNNWFTFDELDPWLLAFVDEIDDPNDPNYPLVVTQARDVTVDATGGFDGAGAAVFPGGVVGENVSRVEINNAGISSLAGAELTVALWVNGDPAFQPLNDVVFDAGEAGSQIRFECPDSQGRVSFTHGLQPRDEVIWNDAVFGDWAGEWNHYALLKNAEEGLQQIYHNGLLVAENAEAFQASLSLDDMRVGATNQPIAQRPYHGKLDDLRLYGSALPQAAILSLAGVETLEQAPVTPADINGDGIVDQTDRDLLEADLGRTQLWP